jgi:hypothetical protein
MSERDALPKLEDIAARFVTDRELHPRICPALGWDSFRAAVKVWERDGFPKINPLTRGRFYPAVVEWLNSKYGLRGNFSADAEDGPENFGGDEHATKRQGARPQARPHPQGRNGGVLLDGEASRARPDGLPRLMHSTPARR